jgi:hypothetical protein
MKTLKNAKKFFPEQKLRRSCSLKKEWNFARHVDLSHIECAEIYGFEFIVSKLEMIATASWLDFSRFKITPFKVSETVTEFREWKTMGS